MMRLISKTVRQERNSSGNLQRSNLVWALIENVVLLETLDDNSVILSEVAVRI